MIQNPLRIGASPLKPSNQGANFFNTKTTTSNLKPFSSGDSSALLKKSSRGMSNNISDSQPITDNLNSRKSVFEDIDIDRIGQGRMLTEGSYHNQFGAKKNLGLKGQLGKLKRAGKFSTTKNLSLENVKQMHDLIADRMKGKAVSSRTIISRHDKMAILKESRKLVKTEGSKFTYQDRDDLKKIVESLRQQYRNKALGKD